MGEKAFSIYTHYSYSPERENRYMIIKLKLKDLGIRFRKLLYAEMMSGGRGGINMG